MTKRGIGGIRKLSGRCPEFEGTWGEVGNCTLYTREPMPPGYTPPPNTICSRDDQKAFTDFNPGVEGNPSGRLYPSRDAYQQQLGRCTCAWASNTAGKVRRENKRQQRRSGLSLRNLLPGRRRK